VNYNLGGRDLRGERFQLMLEAVAFWEEDAADFAEILPASATTNKASAIIDRTVTALLSPGARYAFNLPNDLQIVVGAAAPIGLTSDSPDWGLFFYLRSSIHCVVPTGQWQRLTRSPLTKIMAGNELIRRHVCSVHARPLSYLAIANADVVPAARV
jgi:hypothetical protein